MKRWYSRIISLLLCLAIAATLIPNVPITLGVERGLSEDGKTYYISTFNDLLDAAGKSRVAPYHTIRYVLMNDIKIAESELATLQGLEIDHLTFGDRDHFFLGEFDGGGHTISGLNYDNNLFKVATRTGLFSFVGHKDPGEALKYNTYIHDLTIEGASMHADYCSGILVGEAYNTRFKNVSIVDSSISVNPADNAVLLITDGGVYGGALAGYAKSCKFYNCEAKNTIVRTNSVSGVAALSGKPLYLGGLVGDLESSELEYCRVMGGEVKNRYESSVGALGGFTCYAGGLAGKAGGEAGPGSKIIDCFATCDVSFYVATYVGVGAGCSGHAGGLVGKVDKTGGMIKRCHYAGGTISSYQYNTLLLMIPVQIAHDVNRSGLADIYEPEAIRVYDSYFNFQDGIGPKNGKAANVLGNNKTSADYAPQPDERYMDRAFWENRGYDFAGNLDRSLEDATTGPNPQGGAYYNKWVMYYYDDPVLDADGNKIYENGTLKTVRRGYPVHGLSMAATFDFPGAGEVKLTPTLGEDSLSHGEVSTTDPYRFAVMGFYPTERTPVSYTDGTATKGGVGLSVAANPGYRLDKWYLVPDVAAAGLPDGQHDYFDSIFADETKLRRDLTETNPHMEVADNQLYIARMEALVEFHGLDGKTLSKTTGAAEETPDTTDDWYYYGTKLPAVTPQQAPEDPNAKLIGWTTRRDPGDTTPGWEQVTVTQLAELKEQNAFYETGAPITSTLQLYPVYANLMLNVVTEIEGYDIPPALEDGTQPDPDKTYRAKVGQTYVTSENGAITLRVKSFATGDAALQPTADFPEGYRFLGWYEDGHCVSRERNYTLPDTVDLNVQHTYQARFEYKVDYYVNYINNTESDNGHYAHSTLYATRWELYEAPFTVLKAPDFYRNTFVLWWTEGPQREDGDPTTPAEGYQGPITEPVTVYSYYKKEGDGLIATTITVTSDFPHAAVMTVNNDYGLGQDLIISTKPSAHYNYIFSNLESSYGNGTFYDLQAGVAPQNDDAYQSNYGYADTAKVYTYTSHLTANVTFHDISPNGSGTKETHTVTRRYEQPVLITDYAGLRTYYYGTAKKTQYIEKYTGADGRTELAAEHIAAASPADPVYPGYYFVGWVDVDDPDTAKALNWIYDVSSYIPKDGTGLDGSGRCLTSDPARAKPYIITAEDKVTRAMPNVYPVYAKYNIQSATSVVLAVEGVVAKPKNPTWWPEYPTAEKETLDLTAYNNVAVRPREPAGEKYTIEFITVSIDGGEPIVLFTKESYRQAGKNPDANTWTFTYDVVPGKHYLFTAVYKPYVVVFHRNGNTDTEVVVRDYGRPVGVSYLPTVQDTERKLDYALFVGWTEKTPENGLYHFPEAKDGKSSYQLAQELGYWTLAQTEDTLVTHSMELWPVYATYTVSVKSNIDQELMTTKPTEYRNEDDLRAKVRTLVRTTPNTVSTTVKAVEVEGYKFVGWYTGVQQDETGAYTIFDNATEISEAGDYTLEGGEPFTDKLYTARYKKVYKVIYHNRGSLGGDDLHIDYLYEGEDEDKSLNILHKNVPVQKPDLDENGNLQYNPDGTIKEKTELVTYHEPLNPVPYHLIYATMKPNQSFGQWECHKPDMKTVDTVGDDLVNVYPWSFDKLLPQPGIDPATDPKAKGLIARVGTHEREINLYPTVWTVTVTDEEGRDITDQVTIDIDMSQMDSETYANVKVYVYFDPTNPYTGSEFTVRVQRTRWIETNDIDHPGIANKGRNGVTVIPYTDTTKTHQLAAEGTTGPIPADTKIPADQRGDGEGYAVFKLGDGLLNLTKNAPADKKGETFLFQVTDTTDPAKTWRVAVKCDKDQKTVRDDGTLEVVGSAGETFLRLPPGVYSVTEVDGWAWRQEPMYQVYVGGVLQEAANAHQVVPVAAGAVDKASMTEGAKVVCRNNALSGNHWLVKTADVENLFDPPS